MRFVACCDRREHFLTNRRDKPRSVSPISIILPDLRFHEVSINPLTPSTEYNVSNWRLRWTKHFSGSLFQGILYKQMLLRMLEKEKYSYFVIKLPVFIRS